MLDPQMSMGVGDVCTRARAGVFFNNPVAYGRALSGLFVRPIVLD